MADKYGKILARRAIYVVIAFVLVSLCPSHYNEMRFFGILSGELTIRLLFIRAFTLIPILGLLVSYLVCGAIGFGSGLRHRPGKKLTAASLAIAAVMLLGGLYISCFFLLTGWGGLVLPEPLDYLWQDPGPLYIWWAVMGIFAHMGISNLHLLRRAAPGEGGPAGEGN